MSNKCILVAEDDAAIRRVLADSLAGAGYEVRTAPDGRAALELLLSTPIDLALLDVNMPEISGFKLLRMMQRECPGIPSIILTACGDEQDRVKGLQRRRADFVSAVTHELRTPLTSFSLMTEMLKNKLVPADKLEEYHETLHQESQRLNHLVENVLAFARLTRGKQRGRADKHTCPKDYGKIVLNNIKA